MSKNEVEFAGAGVTLTAGLVCCAIGLGYLTSAGFGWIAVGVLFIAAALVTTFLR